MSDRHLVINGPSVVSEIIDGEVVIMNLASGNYYSSQGVGAVIWGWITERKTCREIERLACHRFAGSPETIAAALGAFFDRLIDEKLVREDTAAPPVMPTGNGDAAAPSASNDPFVLPELRVYTDMQDLLLLDPIHDVDEAGWPTPKVDAAGEV